MLIILSGSFIFPKMQGFYIKGCESQAYPHAQGHADLHNVITGLQQNQPDGYVS